MRRRGSERRRAPEGGAATTAPSGDQAAPPRIDGYSALSVIGRGATATVYRALQDGFDRAVAIKVLNVDISDRRAQKRFQRERALNGRLSDHPNVVTVLDAGFVDGRYPYLAMELFEQGSLTDRLAANGPFDVALALHVGVRIAGALEAAHREGVLHRDVKPQNVLLSRYGEPALADFGIAAIIEMEHSLTAALTPVHAAPEVLEGSEPTRAADIYALGSTLHTILSGVPPFAGPAGEGMLAQLLRITTSEPPRITRADVPASLVAALDTALAKQPASRFATAADLGAALQRVQRELGLPVTGLPVDGDTGAAAAAPPMPPPTGSPSPAPTPLAARVADPDDTIDLAFAPRARVIERFDGTDAAGEPELDPLVAPHVVEAPTLIARQRPPAPLEPPAPRRRWVVPVIATSALAVGAGAAVLVTGALGDGGDTATDVTTIGPPTSSLPSTLPADVSAFAPTGLDAAVVDGTVVLTWQRRADASVPQIVFVYLQGVEPLRRTPEPGATLATISDVDVTAPMCFTVSAVLSAGAAGESAVTADSPAECINGATAQVIDG